MKDMEKRIKHREMVRIIKESELPQDIIIDLLAGFLTANEPDEVRKWFREMVESRKEYEKRASDLLEQLRVVELERFDPVI